MVGKARSSNFTLSEKLDLLKLVRPHIRILEEHTNKHAVIVDKNKCWDTVSEQYNVLGGGQAPPHCPGPTHPLQEAEGVGQTGSDATETRPARVQRKYI